MAYTKLIPRYTPGANVEESSGGERHVTYRLSIPAGPADTYRLAQLDDYTQRPRRQFPLRPPLGLSLSARASSSTLPGTWGFGLWNDPFGLSLGFGGTPFRLPALPNAVWFFGASEESYLSFKSDTLANRSEAQSKGVSAVDLAPRHGHAANGFLAQTFRAPGFHPLLLPAGLSLPFSRMTTRRLMGRVIGEEGIRLHVDVTQWHSYQLDWHEDRVSFAVDRAQVFESPVSPHPPLGLVIWIDNQYAAFTPEGKIGFGVLQNPEPAWLETQDLEVVYKGGQ